MVARNAVLRIRQGIADLSTGWNTVRLPSGLIQPMAGDDVGRCGSPHRDGVATE